MAVPRPDEDQVAELARSWGMSLSDADLSAYTVLIGAGLASCDAVEELWSATAPTAPEAARGAAPADADNPLGAWYVPTEIRGGRQRPAGRADGRDQGQHRGGRRADDERLAHPGGLRPQPRRDRGDPAARGGRDDRRQVGVRGPVLLRAASHTSATGAGAQPVGHDPHDGRVLQRQRRARRHRRSRPGASAATRADRSACRRRSAASSGTSRPTGWCPTRGRSRSSRPSTTSAR